MHYNVLYILVDKLMEQNHPHTFFVPFTCIHTPSIRLAPSLEMNAHKEIRWHIYYYSTMANV